MLAIFRSTSMFDPSDPNRIPIDQRFRRRSSDRESTILRKNPNVTNRYHQRVDYDLLDDRR